MGLSSLPGMQFWNRVLLFFQQSSKYPETPAIKYMEASRIHKYTFLQLSAFLGVFFVQNTKSIAIGFPFMTLMCIPGRLFVLPRFFEGWELLLLDGDYEDIDEWIAKKEGHDNVEDVESGEMKKEYTNAEVEPTDDVNSSENS